MQIGRHLSTARRHRLSLAAATTTAGAGTAAVKVKLDTQPISDVSLSILVGQWVLAEVAQSCTDSCAGVAGAGP